MIIILGDQGSDTSLSQEEEEEEERAINHDGGEKSKHTSFTILTHKYALTHTCTETKQNRSGWMGPDH